MSMTQLAYDLSSRNNFKVESPYEAGEKQRKTDEGWFHSRVSIKMRSTVVTTKRYHNRGRQTNAVWRRGDEVRAFS